MLIGTESFSKTTLLALLLLLLIFTFPESLLGQSEIKGRVIDAQSGEGLPFVHVVLEEENRGVVSDLDGFFEIRSEGQISRIKFSYVGYESLSMEVSPSAEDRIEVRLTRSAIGLSEVVVYAGENPAHRLIRGLFENRDRHNPERNTSFRYIAYNKLHVGIEVDSTVRRKMVEEQDTSMQRFVEFADRQHLFMMESVVERVFRRPNSNREEVLASRISGFQDPIFLLLGTELQSFSFYDDEFVLSGVAYKSPISRNFSRYYEFHMRDTILGEIPGDTTYVVAYYPVKGRNFPALQGLLYINVPDFALQNVIAGPALENESLQVSIRQQYRKIDDKHWFPVQLNTDFEMRMVEIQGVSPQLIVRTYIDSITIDLPREQTRMAPVDVMLNRDAADRDSDFWNLYRRNPLEDRELRAYQFMDSLGQEHNFDQMADRFSSFMQGRFSFGILDFDLNRLLRFNIDEGLRLGAGLRTNHKLSQVFDIGAWYGYGFGDKQSKFGADFSLLMHRDYQIRLRAGYQKEIFESAGYDLRLRRQGGLLSNVVRPIFISQFDLTDEFFASLDFHPRANFQTRLSMRVQDRVTRGDYGYLKNEDQGFTNEFNMTIAGFDFGYAPRDRYFQGIRDRQAINYTFPRFYLSYEHGLNNIFEGDYSFQRVVASAYFEKRFPAFGRLRAELTGGAVFGEVPYNMLFTGKYNFLDKSGFWRKFTLADRNSFETMHPLEFTSDRFAHLMLRYDLGSLLFSPDSRRAPHLEIVARGLIGRLGVDEDRHRGIALKAPEKGYFEGGVEVNRIFNSLGLGVYHRFGEYAHSSTGRNFAFRMTSKFLF